MELEKARKEAIKVQGILPLIVQMGDLQVPVWFGVVQNFAVNILLRTTSIDKFIWGLLPIEQKIVPVHSGPEAILGTGKEAKVTTILLHEASIDVFNKLARIEVANLINILVETKPLVVVVTPKCGLMKTERTQMTQSSKRTLSGRGIHEIRNSVPSRTYVPNLSKGPIVLHKHRCTAIERGPLKCIVAPEWSDGSRLTMELNTLHLTLQGGRGLAKVWKMKTPNGRCMLGGRKSR